MFNFAVEMERQGLEIPLLIVDADHLCALTRQ